MKKCLCLGNVEGSYRQKYEYLAFILILLTSLFLSAFTHACHFIVFISLLITLIVLILYVVLNPVLVYSLRIRVNLHLHRFLTIIILFANHEVHSMETNTSLVNSMPHYDTWQQCVRYNFCYLNCQYTTSFFGIQDVSLLKRFAPGYFAPICLIFAFRKGDAQVS